MALVVPGPWRRRPRAVAPVLVALGAFAALVGAVVRPAPVAVAATAAPPVVLRDAADAADGSPDLVRVAAGQAGDGRLRVALSLAADLVPRDLLAPAKAGGPPGSLCVRLWTVTAPGATPPDFLVCVTSQSDGRTLRATVTKEVAGELPAIVGRAQLSRPSSRSVAVRISRALLGRPARVAFAAEATRRGCLRLSCVDLAPDDGVTRTLRLR